MIPRSHTNNVKEKPMHLTWLKTPANEIETALDQEGRSMPCLHSKVEKICHARNGGVHYVELPTDEQPSELLVAEPRTAEQSAATSPMKIVTTADE